MIDHLLSFPDEAAAKADLVVGLCWIDDGAGGGSWDASATIPGIFLWDPADDTTEVVAGLDAEALVHHPYDDRWRIMIALPELGFIGYSPMDLAANRDTGEVLYSRLPDTLRLQPVFAGSKYPFSGRE